MSISKEMALMLTGKGTIESHIYGASTYEKVLAPYILCPMQQSLDIVAR